MSKSIQQKHTKPQKLKKQNKSKQSKISSKSNSSLLSICEPSLLVMMNKQRKSSNSKQCQVKLADQIKLLLLAGGNSIVETFKSLLTIYQNNPEAYIQNILKAQSDQQAEVRLLVVFVKLIIEKYDNFPFLDREKTIKIFDNLLGLIDNQEIPLSVGEMKQIVVITELLWKSTSPKKLDRIIQNGLVYFLKISISLAKRMNTKSQIIIYATINLIKFNLQQLIKALEKSNQKECLFKDLIFGFFRSTLDALATFPSKELCILPLFDILALSVSSIHSSTFRDLTQYLFNFFKQKMQDKKQEQTEEQLKSFMENQIMLQVLFLTCNVFRMESIFQNAGETSFYSKEVIFLVCYQYRWNFMKIIDELEKIQRNSVPRDVVRAMFKMAVFGNAINRNKELKKIIQKIQMIPKLRQHFKIDQVSNQNKNNDDPLETSANTCEKHLFQFFYKIEKNLCNYSFSHFLDLYVDHPQTFRSEYFVQNLFQKQENQIILDFMKKLTQRWILVQIKTFDFNFYLTHFLKKCIAKDTVHLIAKYIQEIEVKELLKINWIVFKMSFEEDKKKINLPESGSWEFQLAQLTSAGFSDKHMLINKIFPSFSEQLLWKDVIGFIQPSVSYFYVKAFYNVANIQFGFRDSSEEKIQQIISSFESSISKANPQEVYSIFHLLACIFLKKLDPHSLEYQHREKSQAKVFHLILSQSNQLVQMCEQAYQRRRGIMNHVSLNSELINDHIKQYERMKRMHVFFLKNVSKWMERLLNIQKKIEHVMTYEDVITIYLKLSKDVEFSEGHLLRTISNFCSDKFFSNIIELKIHQKLKNGEPITTHRLLLLKQILMNMTGAYYPQNQPNNYLLSELDILHYFKSVLSFKLSPSNERQILKQKLIALQTLFQVTCFFNSPKQSQQSFDLQSIYDEELSKSIMQIATQNPEYVSKYERQLIIYLRIAAIRHILAFMKTPFSVIQEEDCFGLVYELCFDKLVQIRLFILDILVSRFKDEEFPWFFSQKYYRMVYLTIFSIFQPKPYLKVIAQTFLSRIKNLGEEQCCLGLTILLFSFKLILSSIHRGLLREEYDMNVDFFLKMFSAIWLSKKEWEYSAYTFCVKYVDEMRMSFMTSEVRYQSHIQSYNSLRQKSDYILQSEIKQYLRSDFTFEFPPDEPGLDLRKQQISEILYSLPFRFLMRLKLIIQGKSRHLRVLKGKKDIKIDWKMLEKQKIVQVFDQALSKQKINLSLP